MAEPGPRWREYLHDLGGGAVQAGQGCFGAHVRGAAVNHRVLAEGMSAAAAHRRALTRQRGGDGDYGRSVQGRRVGRSAPELARDIAQAAHRGRHDQPMRAAGQVQDHEGGAGSVGRRADVRNPGAGGHPYQAVLHAGPGVAAGAGDVKASVIGACPEDILLHRAGAMVTDIKY